MLFFFFQIELFWMRTINDPDFRRIFCLVHAEKLSYKVSDLALSSLSKHSQGEQGMDYCKAHWGQLSRHQVLRQCWGHVCTYVLRITRRNNVDRIAKPKPHTLKLIMMFNEKILLLACSVLRQIIAGV